MLAIICIIVESTDNIYPVLFSEICQSYIYLGSAVFLLYLTVDIYIYKKSEDDDDDPTSKLASPAPAPPAPARESYRKIVDTNGIKIEETNGTNGTNGTTTSAIKTIATSAPQRSLAATRWRKVRAVVNASSTLRLPKDEQRMFRHKLAAAISSASMSHASTSIFLRAGICVFSIAYLMYVLTNVIALEILQHSHEDPCEAATLVPRYCLVFFMLTQTVFLTKGTYVTISRRKEAVRFGLTHVMAANFCVWLITLVEEIQHTIHYLEPDSDTAHHPNTTPDTNHTVGIAHKLKKASINTSSAYDSSHYPSYNDSLPQCVSEFFESTKVYLIPFIHEYCLVTMGCMASIYASLNTHVGDTLLKQILSSIKKQVEEDEEEDQKLKGRFKHAKIGIAFGVCFTVLMVAAICLSIFGGDETIGIPDTHLSYLLSGIDLVVQTILLFVLIVGFIQLHPFHVTVMRNNNVDSIMLLLAFAGFFMMAIIGMMTALSIGATPSGNDDRLYYGLTTAKAVVELIEGLVQTFFILLGMQKVAATTKQRREKPGRHAITFLVIANIACWLFESLIPEASFISDSIDTLGPEMGAIILDTSVPLVLFFRFHSAVCLAHMYHVIYENE